MEPLTERFALLAEIAESLLAADGAVLPETLYRRIARQVDAEVYCHRSDGDSRCPLFHDGVSAAACAALADDPGGAARQLGLSALWHRTLLAPGFLAFGSRTRTRFDDDQIAFLDRIADSLTRAAERAHAGAVLLRTSDLLARELDLERLVQIVTDEATVLSGAQFGAFFYNVLNEKGESYQLYTLSGAPREAFAKFPMPRNTDVFAPTFRGEGVMRSDDITRDPRYGTNAPYHGMPSGHLPVRSYLAVPVLSRSGSVLGGLFFGHSTPGVFGEQHERTLVALAAQAAVAMDNALLYQEANRELAIRREAQAKLRDANERFRLLFSGSRDGILIFDDAGVFIQINPAAAEILGFPSEALLGRSIADLVSADPAETAMDRYETYRPAGHQVGEFALIRPDGQTCFVEYSATQVGSNVHLCIIREVTQRKRAEDERTQHVQEIERLNERLRQGMQETHHRVKNNLQILAAMIDLRTMDDPETLPAAEFTRLSRHIRVLAAVHDVLTTQEHEGDGEEEVGVRFILERLLPLLQQIAGNRPLLYTLDNIQLPIRQVSSLCLVINELVSNAVKYGHGPIQLAFTVSPDTAQLEVLDDGPGFAPGFTSAVHASVGLELVENLVGWDLFGSVRYQNREEGGARVIVAMPITFPSAIRRNTARRSEDERPAVP